MALIPGSAGCHIHEVWDWNFDAEFNSFLAAVAAVGSTGVIALDTEFPGFIHQQPEYLVREMQYEALRGNVDVLRPIQLGLAVADGYGTSRGAWNFNLRFDVATDLYREGAVAFLKGAGVDFDRHATEGIDVAKLGWRLAGSLSAIRMWGDDSATASVKSAGPNWVTFSGLHDLGYLLKILTGGCQRLPPCVEGFEAALAEFCPRRCELKELLPPYGSLERWAQEFNIQRTGKAHTAGSDALVTLHLFFNLGHADGHNYAQIPATIAEGILPNVADLAQTRTKCGAFGLTIKNNRTSIVTPDVPTADSRALKAASVQMPHACTMATSISNSALVPSQWTSGASPPVSMVSNHNSGKSSREVSWGCHARTMPTSLWGAAARLVAVEAATTAPELQAPWIMATTHTAAHTIAVA